MHVLKTFIILIIAAFGLSFAQEETTIVAPTSEAAQGLDLQAVAEIFKESETLEDFEKALNDTTIGVNNLDLDENGEVDYVRVVEQGEDEAHLIILQALLGEEESQDVATIEVEKSGEEYNMQIQGNEDVYGPDYYVSPVQVHVHTWPLVVWMWGPYYRPYRSPFYFGYYPRWWRPYRPVPHVYYHTRVVHYHTRTTFHVTNTRTVHTRTRVNYQPRSSTLVKTRTTRRTGPAHQSVSKTATIKGKNKSATVGVKKTTNPKTGKKSVAVGAKKTTKTKNGERSVSKGARKTTNPKKGTTSVSKGSRKTKSTARGSRTTTKKRTTTRKKR